MITDHSASDRQHRVRFKRAVRVVPLQAGPPRAFRVLSGNLSRQGMFLSMPEPFTEGTQVALSLEAGGRVLPFAQAEVVWRVLGDGRHPGFGVRFTEFLHPRAHELVGYLVENLDRGVPLPAPKVGRLGRLAIAACLALVAGAALTAGTWALWPGAHSSSPALVAVESAAVEPVDAVVVPAELGSPAEQAVVPEAVVAQPVVDHPVEVAAAPVAAPAAEPRPAVAVLPDAPVARATPVTAVAPTAPRQGPALSSSGQMPLPRGAIGHLTWQQRGDQLTLDLSPVEGAKWSSVFMLRSPSRLVVDLAGKAPAKSFVLPPAGVPHLKGVRLGRLGKTGTRMVFDFEQPPISFSQTGSSLQLDF